jgi:hypothetical protein
MGYPTRSISTVHRAQEETLGLFWVSGFVYLVSILLFAAARQRAERP